MKLCLLTLYASNNSNLFEPTPKTVKPDLAKDLYKNIFTTSRLTTTHYLKITCKGMCFLTMSIISIFPCKIFILSMLFMVFLLNMLLFPCHVVSATYITPVFHSRMKSYIKSLLNICLIHYCLNIPF
jgi:hypothetical protein